jgi:hypothetical protein
VDAVTVGVAAASYGAVVALPVELPSGRRIVPLAALAPALVALGSPGYGVAPTWTIIAATVPAGIAALVIRRRRVFADAVRHVTLLAASAALFAGVARLWDPEGNRLLAAIAVSSLPFLIEDAVAHVVQGSHRRIRVRMLIEELRVSAPPHAVFVSTAGLVSLAFAALGAVSFAILLLPLAATRIGFARFAASRRTYTQTVRALGKLTESAGYIPDGHHARVAELSVAMGIELGLWGEPLRMLELAALLHDVGAVAVPEPAYMATADRAAMGRTGAEILEATGYLAKQAAIVAAHAGAPAADCPVEARILRVASAYDDLASTTWEPLRELEPRIAPEDRDAFDALRRVAARRSA